MRCKTAVFPSYIKDFRPLPETGRLLGDAPECAKLRKNEGQKRYKALQIFPPLPGFAQDRHRRAAITGRHKASAHPSRTAPPAATGTGRVHAGRLTKRPRVLPYGLREKLAFGLLPPDLSPCHPCTQHPHSGNTPTAVLFFQIQNTKSQGFLQYQGLQAGLFMAFWPFG